MIGANGLDVPLSMDAVTHTHTRALPLEVSGANGTIAAIVSFGSGPGE
jgi:hypothetical protein